MSSPIFAAGSYLNYWLRAKGSHSLHSPFLFNLYNKAFKLAPISLIPDFEKIRSALLKNDEPVDVVDFKTGRTHLRTIGSVARTSLSKPKFSNLLRLLCDELKIKTILETGTSLGLNALYLSRGKSVEKVVSIEGSDIIYQLAKKHLSQTKSIKLRSGDIYELFESNLVQHEPELIFLDADHRKSAVDFHLNNINQHCPKIKCIVIHDIYWSSDMATAWQEIVQNQNYSLTIDIFQAGIIFPNQQMEKQHFTLRF
ncbi:MAG: hypothetical protein GY816_06165 [Cytophagales bacterium]|nr:hypothetical protein [Cytophagales bacterium]